MTTPLWYGGVVAAAGLLALGGALKAARPNETANALRALGLPRARLAVRVGGAVEVVVGVAAVVAGGRGPVALVGASYLGFAVFVLVALRRGTPVGSCGCFGEVDAPPTIVHAAVNLAAAAGAGAAALTGGTPALSAVVHHQPWMGVPLLGLAGLAGYLAFLVMAVLPRTMSLALSPHPEHNP